MAIINGTRVFEGQTYRGLLVKSVARDSVTLVNDEGKIIGLSLDIAEAPPLPSLAKAVPGAAGTKDTGATETRSSPARERETKPESRTPSRTEKPTLARPGQAQQGSTR
jgi:hypothetical protein